MLHTAGHTVVPTLAALHLLVVTVALWLNQEARCVTWTHMEDSLGRALWRGIVQELVRTSGFLPRKTLVQSGQTSDVSVYFIPGCWEGLLAWAL